jgi:hypothetical protein
MIEMWARKRADTYLRHGGKSHRRETIQVLIALLREIHQHEDCLPEQIGRRQIIGYYRRHAHLSPATLRRHQTAVGLLWDWLGRTGEPPKPKVFDN